MKSKPKKNDDEEVVDCFKQYKGKYLLCWMPADYDSIRLFQQVGIATQDGKPIISDGLPNGTPSYCCIEDALSEYFPI